jgi:hypothetical protein
MNLSEFIDTYREAITRRIVHSYPPKFRPSEDERPLPPLKRRPMGAQETAIRGAALSLREQRGTTVVGEMGVGKTFIGIAAAQLAGFRRVLVLCPPHLAPKWKREIEETLPLVRTGIADSITDLEALRRQEGSGPQYVVMSHSRAKLGHRFRPAYWMRRLKDEDGHPVRDEETGEFVMTPACPDCTAQIVDPEGVPVSHKQLDRKRCNCPRCGTPLWTAEARPVGTVTTDYNAGLIARRTPGQGPRKYPLADYVKQRMRGYFDLLIVDEVHEHKGRGSAQGLSAGILADACGKSLALSGTLMGGYASTLFHLLYRFSPEIRSEFGRSEESKWVQRYGFLEQSVRHDRDLDDDPTEDGSVSRRKSYRNQTRERPGLAPAALFHIIGHSLFLKLADVASGLPPYEEQIQVARLDDEPNLHGFSQASAYQHLAVNLKRALLQALERGSQRLLSTYLQALLAYPEGCTRGETVFDPDSGEVIVQLPPLDEGRVYPKEQQLIDLVAQERLAGRRVLVYATHTGTRDITGRLSALLERHGFRTAVMKADRVEPSRREAWVAQRVEEGIDVLICHPRLVQTGLDLIQFPTLAWYETDYSVYTMRQASRRSWRIGQTRPVKVVFMAYRNTLQADALKLVAQKLQSSLAVEGELPEDGLAGYGDSGDDLMMALARKLVSGDSDDETVEDIFQQAQQIAAEADQLLVDADWRRAEPQPATLVALPSGAEPAAALVPCGGHHSSTPAERTAGEAVPEQALFRWAEFLTEPDEPPRRAGRRSAQTGPSLFDWALEREQQAGPVAAGG